MKKLQNVVPISLCLAIAMMIGCSKEETAPSAPAAPAAESSVPAEAQKAAEAVASTATSEANSLIDQAKSLIAENKYSEAVDLLKRLSDMQLTPEQKKMVDDLMAQAQKALAGAAASDATKSATDAVGGALGK